MKNNIIRLENYQVVQESHSVRLEKTIESLVLKGQSFLEFEPIPKVPEEVIGTMMRNNSVLEKMAKF